MLFSFFPSLRLGCCVLPIPWLFPFHVLCCLLSCDLVWHISSVCLDSPLLPSVICDCESLPSRSLGTISMSIHIPWVSLSVSSASFMSGIYEKSYLVTPLVSGWAGTLWGGIRLPRFAVLPRRRDLQINEWKILVIPNKIGTEGLCPDWYCCGLLCRIESWVETKI